jgi:PAS domain S-box-containing protein
MTGARILVVDDNALNRKIIATIATNQGHLVEQAVGGQEALQRLRAGDTDVVLLDLIMPEMDGFEVLRRMKSDEHLRHIPVVVISGMEGMENVIRSLEMGAADYLPKPVDAVLLKARLSAILTAKRLRDVERRHLIEVRAIQARLSAVIDGSPLGIILIDLQGRLMEANPTFHRLVRQEGVDLRGRAMADFCGGPGHCAEEMLHFLRRRDPGRFCNEAIMARGDASTFNVRLTMSIVPGEGTEDFAVALVEDVTERTLAVQALRQNEESLRLVFESAPFPMLITSAAKGEIIEMNHRAAELFEFDKEAVRGRSALEFYQDPNDRKRIVTAMETQGFIESMEVPFVTWTGKHRWLMMSAREATLGGVTCFLIATFDITERRDMEHALQQANRKLGLLNSITRHDILNQTLVLSGYTDLLRRQRGDKERAVYLERMDIATDNIRKQINFTRDYQDMGVRAAEWFELDRVMRSSFQQLSPQGVALHLDTEEFSILADPLVEKVFYNLIDNSMRHGKEVHHIGLTCTETEEQLIVAYTDDGGGITSEDKQRLFEKGFGKNTGLGLFLSKEILGITSIAIVENGIPGEGVRFEMQVPKGRFRKPARSKEAEQDK